jgi:hypothetical protein
LCIYTIPSPYQKRENQNETISQKKSLHDHDNRSEEKVVQPKKYFFFFLVRFGKHKKEKLLDVWCALASSEQKTKQTNKQTKNKNKINFVPVLVVVVVLALALVRLHTQQILCS